MSKKRNNGEEPYEEAKPVHPPKPTLKLDYNVSLEAVGAQTAKSRQKVGEKLKVMIDGNYLNHHDLLTAAKKMRQIHDCEIAVNWLATFMAQESE